MSNNSNLSYTKLIITAGVVTTALYAFAVNRKVTIPLPGTAYSNNLNLINPSTQTVTANVACYDASGNSTNLGAISLAAKQATTYSLGSSNQGCSGTNYMSTNGISICMPSVTYASASANCASGYTLCSASQWQSSGLSFSGAWLSNAGFNSFWSFGYSSPTNDVDGSTNAPTTTYPGSSYYCNTATNGGGGTSYSNCSAVNSSNYNYSACCASGGAYSNASFCEVEITSGGHLQSPQFKGGSPF